MKNDASESVPASIKPSWFIPEVMGTASGPFVYKAAAMIAVISPFRPAASGSLP